MKEQKELISLCRKLHYRMVMIFVLLMIQTVMCELNKTHLIQQQHLVTCLIQISNQYFDQQIMISLPRYDEQSFRKKVSGGTENKFLAQEGINFESILLQKLLISGQSSVFVYRDADESGVEEMHSKHSSYLIYLQRNVIGSLNYRLQCLKKNYFRNLKSRFVVILDKKFEDPEKEVTNVLSKLWEFKVINVIVLLKLRAQDVLQIGIVPKDLKQTLEVRKFDNVIGIYTWFPYRDYKYCYNTRKFYLLDVWIMEGNGHFILNSSLFPDKVGNSLNKCTVVVSTTEYYPFVEFPIYIKSTGSVKAVYDKGWDISLLNIITEVMNVSVQFLPPSREKFGRFLMNGTFTGIIGDLAYSRCDIAVGGLPLTPPFIDTGDYSAIYSRTEFVWLIPCARRLHGWRNIFRIFSSTLWLCVFLSISLAACIIHCLAKCTLSFKTPGTERYLDMSESSYKIFAVFLGTSVSSIPRTTPLRVFFLAWIGYSLAINTVIQSFLTSFLVRSDMEEQVSSFNDILNSGMEYGFTPQYDIFFSMAGTSHEKDVLGDRKNCGYEKRCLHRVAHKRDFAMLFSKVNYDYEVKHDYVDPDRWTILICTIPESFLGFYFTVYTPKGHQLLGRLNVVISRILQAGLYDKIQDAHVHWMRLKLKVHGEETDDDGPYQLSLQHLKVAFFILMAGHLIGLIVFLKEIVYWKFIRSA